MKGRPILNLDIVEFSLSSWKALHYEIGQIQFKTRASGKEAGSICHVLDKTIASYFNQDKSESQREVILVELEKLKKLLKNLHSNNPLINNYIEYIEKYSQKINKTVTKPEPITQSSGTSFELKDIGKPELSKQINQPIEESIPDTSNPKVLFREKYDCDLNCITPEDLLEILVEMSAIEILEFKEMYFRPVECKAYQNLLEKISIYDHHEYLCYAILTDDITKLDLDCIKEMRHDASLELEYQHKFEPCLDGILWARKKRKSYKEFDCEFRTEMELDNISDLKNLTDKNKDYHNLAGITFTNDFEFVPEYASCDFRYFNLENTTWKCRASRISFAGANLKNAKFEAANFKLASFFQADCEGISIKWSKFNEVLFKNTNLKNSTILFGGSLQKAEELGKENLLYQINYMLQLQTRKIVFDSCNFENANLNGGALNVSDFVNCDLKNTKYFSTDDFKDIKLFEQKMDYYFQALTMNIRELYNNQQAINYNESFIHGNTQELRYAMVDNILETISEIEMEDKNKIEYIEKAMNHALFDHRHKFLHECETQLNTFFSSLTGDTSTPKQSGCRKRFEEFLYMQHFLRKDKPKGTV